jgi:hypothetical protein
MSNKDSKRRLDTQFNRCVKTRKVESSVEGSTISRRVSHLKTTVETTLKPVTSPGLNYPPLAPISFKQPVSVTLEADENSLEEMNEENDKTQVRYLHKILSENLLIINACHRQEKYLTHSCK